MKCPTCQDEMRQVPAGVSKSTGRPYRAFWACDKPACKEAKRANYNRTTTAPIQTPIASDNDERIVELEKTIAKIRIAYADLNKRLQGLETIVESLTSKQAVDLHQSIDARVKRAADDLGGVVIDKVPWED